jgi:hypothetical protein
MTQILIEIGCHEGAKLCGPCKRCGMDVGRPVCEIFQVYLPFRKPSGRVPQAVRCQPCLDAEKAEADRRALEIWRQQR